MIVYFFDPDVDKGFNSQLNDQGRNKKDKTQLLEVKAKSQCKFFGCEPKKHNKTQRDNGAGDKRERITAFFLYWHLGHLYFVSNTFDGFE